MADYDLIVGPTLACLPVDNASDGNTVGPSRINDVEVDPLIGWCPTYLFNFTGHPAASIPAGMSDDGLPVGMQIAGRRYADVDVLAGSASRTFLTALRASTCLPVSPPRRWGMRTRRWLSRWGGHATAPWHWSDLESELPVEFRLPARLGLD